MGKKGGEEGREGERKEGREGGRMGVVKEGNKQGSKEVPSFLP